MNNTIQKSDTIDKFQKVRGFYNSMRAQVCFVNATTQCLFHCKYFVAMMEKLWNRHQPGPNCDLSCATCALGDVYDQLLNGSKEEDVISSIADYAENLGFEYGQQHDASEFLMMLMNQLREEERKDREGETPTDTESAHPIVLKEVFGYLLARDKYCTVCQRVSGTYIDSSSSVPHILPLKNFSVEESILEALKGDMVESTCGKCGVHGQCAFCPSFQKLPKVFILLLTRPIENFQNAILMPEILNVPQETAEYIFAPVSYELRGVLHRLGPNPSFGHYLATVKREQGWLFVNDEEVCASEPSTESVMMLFYEQTTSDDSMQRDTREQEKKEATASTDRESEGLETLKMRVYNSMRSYLDAGSKRRRR